MEIGTVATVCRTGVDCWSRFTTIVVSARTTVLQQECDAGICVEPHISAICSQQARSWAVIVRSGMTHANKGADVQ